MAPETGIRVRRLTPEDAATASRLMARFHDRDVSPAYIQSVLNNPDNFLFAALREEDVVGFLFAHLLDWLSREHRHLFIYELEVAEPHRRRGIGRELMNAALGLARDREIDAFLLTNHSNPEAIAFYKALGGVVKTDDGVLFVYRHRNRS